MYPKEQVHTLKEHIVGICSWNKLFLGWRNNVRGPPKRRTTISRRLSSEGIGKTTGLQMFKSVKKMRSGHVGLKKHLGGEY